MALTSLKLNEKDRLQFITDQLEEGLKVMVYTCDENWKPQGEPAISGDKRTEEVFHRELRQAALEKGHYVPEHSTDPDWNPGLPTDKTEPSNEPTL